MGPKTARRLALLLVPLALLGLFLLPGLLPARAEEPPPPPRGCEWQWDGTRWNLNVFLCAPQWCHPPARAGAFNGETVYAPCSDTPPGEGGCCGN